MADPNNDKALIASSEFDPTAFVAGIDQMTDALGRLSKQEDQIKSDLGNINNALKANQSQLKANQDQITALDKTAAGYADSLKQLNAQHNTLTTQQKGLQDSLKANNDNLKQVNATAADYKSAVAGITAVTKQVQDQNKGRTLFDVASLNQQVLQVQQLGDKIKNIFAGKIPTQELDQLEEKLAGTSDEFKQLSTVIDFVKSKLGTLDPNTQEFQDLNQVVEIGTQVLNDFGTVQDSVAKRSPTVTQQLRNLRNQMSELSLAGKEGTKEFHDLSEQASLLQHTIDKTGERVRVFASDTQLIEGGVEAIRGIAAGFELAQGASELFGVKNEGVQESIKKLTAIMAIANGLQEVSNLLKKESALRLLTEEVATKAYTISQRVLAATLGTTAAASKALSVTLAATGIGALVLGVGLLIEALSKWADEDKEVTRQQELLNVAVETAIDINKSYVDAIGDAGSKFHAEAEKRQAEQDKLVQGDVAQTRQRAKNAEELRKIDFKTLQDQLSTAQQLVRNERAGYDAAANLRREALEGRIKISDEELKELNKTVENYTKIQETAYALENQVEVRRLNNERDRAKDRNDIRRAEIARVEDFLKRLEDLRKQLALAQLAGTPQDAAAQTKAAGINLTAQLQAINRDVRKGILTRGQGSLLKDLLGQVNGVELANTLKEFRKKAKEAAENLEDTITDTQLKVGEQRVALIRDQLQAEAAAIKLNYEKETEELTRSRRELLKGIQNAFDQGLISKDQAAKNAADVEAVYLRLFAQLQEKTARAQEQLARSTFESLQRDTQLVFAAVQAGVSENDAKDVQRLTTRYLNHQISFERYQRELTRINEKYARQRIDTSIRENEELLQGVRDRLEAEQDPQQRKALQDQISALRKQIAELKKQLNAADVQGVRTDKKEFDDKVSRIAAYAQAIGTVIDQVVEFWARANQAEQAQLDRSITIQQRRVDAATRIAERGNAEYLRLEQDRLDQLQLKQENAARRQLAINAVLQTSQALTAFISALAQGIATGGPLGGLAIAAAVLGAIAEGYAIVASLKPDNSTQGLKHGTKSVERNGAPAGEDTVPAMLTAGEAVLPVEVNQAYKPAVDAIFDRKIPAEELNAFVNSYPVNRRQLPTLNHERLSDAAEFVVNYDGKLLEATQTHTRKLEEHGDLLREVNKNLKSMGISVNVDKDGLAIAVLQAIDKHKISKRV